MSAHGTLHALVSARGWRRLVLVLGIVWIPVGYFWGCSDGAHHSDKVKILYSGCIQEAKNEVEEKKCDTDFESEMTEYKYDPEFYGIVAIIAGEI